MKKGSLAFTHATIRTRDPRIGICEALLVEEGVVTAVGPSQEIERAALNSGIPPINLTGQTVIPGPIDTHFHFVQTGLDLSALELGDCASVDDVLQIVQQAARAASETDWILGRGLDEFKIRQGRPPTASELDRVISDRPIFLGDRGLHYAQLNTLAMDLLGVHADMPGVRVSDDGRPTGQVMEESVGAIRQRLNAGLGTPYKRQALLTCAQHAAACGLTAVHAMEGGDFSGDEEITLLLEMQDELPIRVALHWNTHDVASVLGAGLRVLGGDLWLDGSIGSRTAAVSQPYADAPDVHGLLYYSPQDVRQLVEACLDNGLQVGFHAIGDRAIEQALGVFETVARNGHLPDRGCRLDHFGLPTPGQIARAASLGVVVSTQPTFPYLRGAPGSVYEARLGKARVAQAYPLRALIDAGILVAGGSDSNVLPAGFMLAVHAAVHHPNEHQRISPDQAIQLYTESAARIGFDEATHGSLTPGKAADMLVLDGDPCAAPSGRLQHISVVMTIVGGSIAYARG